MKTLLINPPLFKNETNVWKHIDSCTPPFGLMILGAILLKKGLNVQIIDCNAERIPVSQVSNNLPQEKFDYIGVTATTALISNALEIAAICRNTYPDAKIIMGGVHPTIMPEEVLRTGNVDFVIRGEGEETFPLLLDGGSYSNISGISYYHGSEINHNPVTSPPIDLDTSPFPAYHLLPMEKYHTALGSSLRSPNIGMIASRGCPGRCTFCYGHIFGRKIRFRSPALLVEEIQFLQKNYGIREIAFYDDTFTTFKKKVTEFCELIIEKNIDLTWSCFSRVDTVDLSTLKLMKKAGCHQVSIGVESGDEQILKTIKKKINLNQAKEMVDNCKKAGITVRACFMFGNPGETMESIRTTIDFSKKLNPDIVLYNITTPFPGTEMYEYADRMGYLITKDWRDYDLSQVVMKLPTIDPQKLVNVYRSAYREFYFRPSYLMGRLIRIRSMHDIRTNWNAFRSLLHFSKN